MRISRRSAGAVAAAVALLAVAAGCATAPPPTTSAARTPIAARPSTAPLAPTKPAPAKPAPAKAAPAAAAPAKATPECATTPAGTKHVYVSISQQHLWACTGQALTVESAVTTGASALTNVNDATPVGTYAITSKTTHVTLAGSDVNGSWNDPVTYWMPFAGGDGFHDAPWQTFPLGSPLYTSQGSHGCVHVALSSLATLYGWAPVGTPVTVTA